MKLLIRFKALVLFIFFVVFLYKSVVLLHQFHYSNQHIWLFEGLLISTLHKYIFLFVMHAFTRIIFHTWIQLCVIYHQLSTIQQLEVSWWAVYFVMKCVLFLFCFWLCWCSLRNICVDFAVPLWNAVLLLLYTCCTSKNANISEWARILMRDGWN